MSIIIIAEAGVNHNGSLAAADGSGSQKCGGGLY